MATQKKNSGNQGKGNVGFGSTLRNSMGGGNNVADDKKRDDENYGVAQEQINMLMEMGYTHVQALDALKKNGDNAERALEFLFEQPDYDFNAYLIGLKKVKEQVSHQTDISEVNKHNSNVYDLYGK